MRRTYFLEGFVLGAVAGYVATLMCDGSPCCEDPKEAKTKKPKATEEEPKKSTEELVNKTLKAIDQGFEKMSKLVQEKKGTKSKS